MKARAALEALERVEEAEPESGQPVDEGQPTTVEERWCDEGDESAGSSSESSVHLKPRGGVARMTL